jgi:hypothetical protein
MVESMSHIVLIEPFTFHIIFFILHSLPGPAQKVKNCPHGFACVFLANQFGYI